MNSRSDFRFTAVGPRGRRRVDLTGQRFGKLIALRPVEYRKHYSNGASRTYWECRCDCGEIGLFPTGRLRSGGITRCPSCRRRDLQTLQRGWQIGRLLNRILDDYIKKSQKRLTP